MKNCLRLNAATPGSWLNNGHVLWNSSIKAGFYSVKAGVEQGKVIIQ